MNIYDELSDSLACLLREKQSVEFCKELFYTPEGIPSPGHNILTKEQYDQVNEQASQKHMESAKRYARILYTIWHQEDYNNSLR